MWIVCTKRQCLYRCKSWPTCVMLLRDWCVGSEVPVNKCWQRTVTWNCVYGDHDIVILKRSHQYYYQVQTQLAVAGKSWGDFFVYSQAGYYLARIVFDEAWWAEVLPCLTYFWEKCVAPALMLDSLVVISEDLQDPLNQGSDIMPERRSNSPPTVLNPTKNTASHSTEVRKRKAAPVRGQKKGKSKGRPRHSKTVYECGHCFDTIKDKVGNEEENNVQCDGCDTWYHFTCVGQGSATLDLMDKWFCSDCPWIAVPGNGLDV